MVDDLIVTDPKEPYRMFTSRAEHRLLLRHDNVDQRLMRKAAGVGLIGFDAVERLDRKMETIDAARRVLQALRFEGGKSAYDHLRRPEVTLATLAQEHAPVAALTLTPEHAEVLEIEAKYAGYVARQQTEVQRMLEQEHTPLPADLNYASLEGLGSEAKEKLARLRPHTLGAATRIDGVRPPDIALLSVHLKRLQGSR
jgi:tRNA uridine 5-carboxymethylaminomethyl modification enzyme